MIFDLHECFEDAAERAGIELRTGFDFKSMRRSLHFLLREWANDGYNLYAIQPLTLPLVAGTTTYALPADCIDVSDVVIRSNVGTAQQADITVNRISLADYHAYTNKLARGRPTQFTVERRTTSSITFYLCPEQAYTAVLWYMQYVVEPDAGEAVPSVPDRFVPALISGLAYHLALKRPALADRIATLGSEYQRQWGLAKDEDRDRADFYVLPFNTR